jgi:hypothetical protein
MGGFLQTLFGYQKKKGNLFLTEVLKEIQNNIKGKQKLLLDLNHKNHELVVTIEKISLELEKISKEEIKIKEQAWEGLYVIEKGIGKGLSPWSREVL